MLNWGMVKNELFVVISVVYYVLCSFNVYVVMLNLVLKFWFFVLLSMVKKVLNLILFIVFEFYNYKMCWNEICVII